METISAIVILIDHDVHSVYLVPAVEANIHNMSKLRQIRDQVLKKHGRTENIRIQRVLVSETDRQANTFELIAQEVEQVVENIITTR